ncbi:MAG: creatininase family protein [Planctomycetia bacterium]|nr:creatininase family protein [Planctomycetia bacterium]
MTGSTGPRRHVLHDATYRQLLDSRPNVAVLPWGATEAHNYHLPHGTDVIEAVAVAELAAERAATRGARPIVLPAVPFGNNAQQQDQVATIHLSTPTALAILRDVTASLVRQGIDRLVLVNAHGGNDFKPMIRDVMLELPATIVLVNFWQVRPDALRRIFTDPGDHAGQMETAVLMHLRPDLVVMAEAGRGGSVEWALPALRQPGAWTPRPWSHVHPDTGSGDPAGATPAQGAEYLTEVAGAVADLIVQFSAATRGQIPYV